MRDFEKVILSDVEVTILKLLESHDHLNTDHFFGYFRFFDISKVQSAIHDLRVLSFIVNDPTFDEDGYVITHTGRKYLLFLKKQRYKKIPIVLGALAALVTVIGFVLTFL